MLLLTPQKETPLANAVFWAVRKGNLALLQLLLNSGRVDADCRDSVRWPRAPGCSEHDPAVLVSQGARLCPSLKNLFFYVWSPQLNFQAVSHIETPKFIISASVFQCGTTALMVASYNGHYECVRELIMQGSDINYQRKVWWENNWLRIMSAVWAHLVSSIFAPNKQENARKFIPQAHTQPHIFGLWFFPFKHPLFVIDRHIHPLPHVAMFLGDGSSS